MQKIEPRTGGGPLGQGNALRPRGPRGRLARQLFNGGPGQEVAGTPVGPQQDHDPAPQRRVPATGVRQVGRLGRGDR
jgi:hypothetical protein